MFTRYLTLIIRNPLTRQQQRSIDTATKQIAAILLIGSLIAAACTLLKD